MQMEYTVKHKTVSFDGVEVEMALERNELGSFLIIQACHIVPPTKEKKYEQTSIMIPEVGNGR